MKMSDYFKGYVSKIYGDYLGNVCFVVEGQRIDVELDFDKCESAVLHAINNHDRLTEENAKLRHELANLIYMTENNTGNEPSLSCFHLAIDEAKQLLLNQLKDQNNDK